MPSIKPGMTGAFPAQARNSQDGLHHSSHPMIQPLRSLSFGINRDIVRPHLEAAKARMTTEPLSTLETSDVPVRPRRGLVSRIFRWIGLAIWFVFVAILTAWASFAIYYSNLPWPDLRLVLALAFAAFAIFVFIFSRGRRMYAAYALVFLGSSCGGS
jgi:hypothetical protein